ncbi:RNA-directed DNA polymerase, eukaryota, reverse transcriptase zinc-binding domain protein, partial [Tanacetum coccineum]
MNKNRVEFICGENGERFEGDKVVDQFVEHFKNFLSNDVSVKPLSILGDIAIKTLPLETAKNMILEVTDEEIKKALFDIDSNKAAGPDGFTSYFFKKAWNVIGEDIPGKVSDFRPIACCNVLYKCISKILTERIKEGLNMVVSLNQSAFIPGKHIQDNILISQELFKGYNRKQGAKREVLNLMGFHEVMVGWIMTCITTTSFSLCVNGEVCGYFQGGRGLRQGDPISPYIFTMVMEVLNMIMIKEIKDFGKFKYHYGCKELKLTHLCFVDDLLILCNGDKESLDVVKKALNEFSGVFGLLLNLNKSTIFFGSIEEGLKRELLQILPFSMGSLPVRYLGVPLIAKKLGVKDCKCLVDNVEKRIINWRNKLLLYVGRIQLISSVLSSLHQYWALVYILPKTVVKDLNKLFKRFIWRSGDSTKGKARVSWNMVCRPKDQESLWVKWVNTVKLKGNSFWEIESNAFDSWGWNSMLYLRDKMKPFVSYKIGNGRKTSPWYDKWCDNGPIKNFISKIVMFEARFKGNETVREGISNGNWDWPDEWYETLPVLKQIIVPQLSNKDDSICWINADNKEVKFSTKDSWLSL